MVQVRHCSSQRSCWGSRIVGVVSASHWCLARVDAMRPHRVRLPASTIAFVPFGSWRRVVETSLATPKPGTERSLRH